jgi:DNA mismatch repair protein MutS
MVKMKLTPAMQQYVQIKDEHPDCLVLFRMGDFYETFYEDAREASKILGITLTSRGKGETKAPLAGIPYHSLEQYLKKLITAGKKVAIVEQLEDPKKAKGLVKRGLVRIISPGTVIEDSILSKDSNNYLCSISFLDEGFGISFCDISTGEFLTTEANNQIKLFGEIEKINPSEILVPISQEDSEIVNLLKKKNYFVNSYDDRFFWEDKAKRTIKEFFNVDTIDGFALTSMMLQSSGALINYIQETQMGSTNIQKIQNYSVERYMILDSPTQRNLELIRNIRDNSTRGTLFEVINKTQTAMGTRMLKKWLLRPLTDVNEIIQRHNAIESLQQDLIIVEDLKDLLNKVSDIERLLGKISYKTANARDLLSLKNSLEVLPKIKKTIVKVQGVFFENIKRLDELKEIKELIDKAIKDDPPLTIREGNFIRKGYSKELDELRSLISDNKRWILDFEDKERERTGIKNLKIKFNKVFGYFIEVTKTNLGLVPDDYIRKQTQVNSERFITRELKEKESLVLSAQDKINNLEYELIMDIIEKVFRHNNELLYIAKNLSELDCILALSLAALENNYTKPEISDGNEIIIKQGRHPVVERIEHSFVSNDLFIGKESLVHIITGPNMAGKSTFLRQNALIVLLAQMGSFVPAQKAKIGIVDRIFSRVGAYDDLSMGQSTFMIEMIETSNILNNATSKSFVIMDEVGRGTSTYDGLALAWAIVEYLLSDIKAKTLFATHYHELNNLKKEDSLIKNFNVLVKEEGKEVIFLHKIVEGGTDKSYGVHVAKLAGLPNKVVDRAKHIMRNLTEQEQITNFVVKGYTDETSQNEEKENFLKERIRENNKKDSNKDSRLNKRSKEVQKSLFGF